MQCYNKRFHSLIWFLEPTKYFIVDVVIEYFIKHLAKLLMEIWERFKSSPSVPHHPENNLQLILAKAFNFTHEADKTLLARRI